MGESHGAGPAAVGNSSKTKKASQRRSKAKQKKKNAGVGQWKVGSRCRAVYSEDGQTYDAVVVRVDGGSATCMVRYDYYNNEEVQRLADLLLPQSNVHASHNNSLRSDVSA